MLVKDMLCVSSAVAGIGFREPMPSKPIPEFRKMPLIPLFSQKIPFLKLMQFP